MRLKRLRAVMALGMAALFFVLAAAASLGLAWAGLWLARAASSDHARFPIVALFAVPALLLCSALIGWSIAPRVHRFVAPGPELFAADQPALFAELTRIARRTGEAMPEHVYLVGDVNAFVSQRGGLLGFFSRRIMGVGLPLLALLSVSELRAVLTHEFGHFAGGDTRLGPWLIKARVALIRTLDTLSGAAAATTHGGTDLDRGLLSWLFIVVGAPFRAYASWYLRLTQGLSRVQEYAADALAVRLEGAPALTRGLTRTHGGALAFHIYLRNEFAPILEHQALPPFTQGFQAFIAVAEIAQLIERVADASGGQAAGDALDSHPPLRERLELARGLEGPREAQLDLRSALELLQGVPALEAALAASWVEQELTPVEWTQTGALLALGWQQRAPTHAKLLEQLTPTTLPREELQLRELLGKELARGEARSVARDELLRWSRDLYAEALFALLIRAGYLAHNRPGQSIRFTRGEEALEPGPIIASYLEGELAEDAWREVWTRAGIGEATFGGPAAR